MQKINFENKPSTNSPINANNLNLLQDNVEDAINEVDNKLDVTAQSVILASCINNLNTNISINQINNLLVLSGVIYFSSKPGTWTKFIDLPSDLQQVSGYGNLIEESTGLTRPVLIQNGGIVMTADLSTAPIYAYINMTFTK